LSKILCEILSNKYYREYGIRIYLPRPGNTYGPGDHFGKSNSRVIPTFIERIADGKSISIRGDGSQIRQFTHVADVVESILALVERQFIGAVNISTSETVSVRELANIICQYFKTTPNVDLDPSMSKGDRTRILDCSRLARLIDFEFLPLGKGIWETVAWYLHSMA
jgi:nucleoside-diphosphate-sugar epimerase